MAAILSFIFFVLALGVVVMMITQWLRGTHDIFTLRNFFLIGFVIFQLVSGGLSMATLTWGDVYVDQPVRTGTIYLFACVTFLVLFCWSYQKGWLVRGPAWTSSFPFPAFSSSTLLSLGWMFLIIGFIFRIVIGRNVPILGVLTDVLAIGILSCAAGLAMWAWAPRLWNFAIAVPAICIIAGSVVSTVVLTFGRRDVLSVMITVLFAAYQSHWRHQSLTRLAYRMLLIGSVGLLFLAAFSTARSMTVKETDVGEFISHLADANVSEGLLAMGTGQYAAANSMWVIENHPDPLPYFPLHSVMYTFINPIPRAIWEDKPMALGYTMVRDAHVYRYGENFTLGPGIIGHIFYDNPWLTLLTYPIFFGLFFRFFDEFVRVRPANPFVVLPVVVGTGELVGIPRGEVGLFMFRMLAAMIAAWVSMRFCAGVLRSVKGVQPAPEELQADPNWDAAEAGGEDPVPELHSASEYEASQRQSA